jgi:Na+-translocating ferredoxin:NAD+ oxidoreductase RnfD subunit
LERRHLIVLIPALLLAAGMLLSCLLAVQQSDWLVLAAPLALALSVLVGEALEARLRGLPARPSPSAMILAASFLLASLIVAVKDPGLLKGLMPLLGTLAAATLPMRGKHRNACMEPPRS